MARMNTEIPRGTGDGHEREEAVRASLSEDLDAGFAVLVQAHQRTVYSVAVSITARAADAEDLVAEAFLRAYRGLRSFDKERIAALKLKPWLLTILLNTWRNSLRDSSRRPREVPLDGVAEPSQPGPGVEQLAELGESRRHLLGLLQALPERQRVAVVLRHVVELPTSEVAAVLGCPDGTAKSHISRGLQRLRALDEWRES
jgi:RNA polymerase sigma-70 factor (ECF subfamily)